MNSWSHLKKKSLQMLGNGLFKIWTMTLFVFLGVYDSLYDHIDKSSYINDPYKSSFLLSNLLNMTELI